MPSLSIQAFVLLLQVLITVMFCRMLVKALAQVKESNRTIQPVTVWILLVPIVEKLWNFKVVWSVASSLHKEFADRDFEIEKRPGFIYGMIYAISSAASYALGVVNSPEIFSAAAAGPIDPKNPPTVVIITGAISIVSFVFFVLYWMKISWYSKVLENDEQNAETT